MLRVNASLLVCNRTWFFLFSHAMQASQNKQQSKLQPLETGTNLQPCSEPRDSQALVRSIPVFPITQAEDQTNNIFYCSSLYCVFQPLGRTILTNESSTQASGGLPNTFLDVEGQIQCSSESNSLCRVSYSKNHLCM